MVLIPIERNGEIMRIDLICGKSEGQILYATTHDLNRGLDNLIFFKKQIVNAGVQYAKVLRKLTLHSQQVQSSRAAFFLYLLA